MLLVAVGGRCDDDYLLLLLHMIKYIQNINGEFPKKEEKKKKKREKTQNLHFADTRFLYNTFRR